MEAVFAQTGLVDIAARVARGERLSREDGLALMHTPHLAALGAFANTVRERLHGDRTYYIINRHLNYTNICVNQCRFCAFSRREARRAATCFPWRSACVRPRTSAAGG